MRVQQSVSAIGAALIFLFTSSIVNAIVIAEFDFESVDGTMVPNSGVGADGILGPNATVVGGVLDLDHIDLADPMNPHGLMLPLGLDNPFGGGADWRVKFDFSTEDVADQNWIGAFFSSDGGLFVDGEFNNDEQRGSLNIFMNSAGAVAVDAWWIGAITSQGDLNDGEQHTVDVTYTAAESLWKLVVDGELADEAEWEYSRDATLDRVRVGGVSNPDFGFEIDGDANAFDVIIDNLLIEGTPAPDLNMDGEISILDWDLFVAGFGSDLAGLSELEAFLKGDLNADGLHGPGDFVIFSTAFDAANGAGALAASVPEPEGIVFFGLGIFALLLLCRRNLRHQLVHCAPVLVAATVSVLFIGAEAAQADLLVEYTFDSGQTSGGELRFVDDTSGNGRDGKVDFGDPKLAGGKLVLTGDLGNLPIQVPLGDASPFDGTKDFTIDISFRAGLHAADEAGHLLMSSADSNDPEAGLNHSMAIFIEPGGDIVYDNFFVGEVRMTPPASVINDGVTHELRVMYFAPEDLGNPDDPNPGEMLLRLDGAFLGAGEIAPSIIGIDQHEVFLGASLNEEFPYECEINEDGDDECFIRPLLGELDVVRIFDEAFVPTQMSAEVNRANGDITLKGGEFQRDVQYYEISSEGGALNSAAWSGGNLDQQNLDSVGDGSGDTWDVLTASSERVVEAFLKGGTLFEDGTEVTLSGTWGGGAEDLLFQIVTSDNNVLSLDVNYVGEGNGNQGGVCNPNTLGDIDENGTVDFGDFLILSANFGQAAADHKTGDIDCNGTVAFGDFLVLSSNFGQAVSVAAASVPEPSSWVMIWMVSLVGLAFARRG